MGFFKKVNHRVVYFVCEQYFKRDDWACPPRLRPVKGATNAIDNRNTAMRIARDVHKDSKGEIKTSVVEGKVIYSPSFK